MIYLTIILVVLIVCITIILYRKLFGHIHKWKFIKEQSWIHTRLQYPYGKEEYIDRIYECELCGKLKKEKY